MQNPKEPVPTENGQNKRTNSKKKKKEGKIEQVYKLSKQGLSVKDVAQKTGLKEQIVRSYLWRKKNPEKGI